MSKASHTFFMGMTLRELYRWISSMNEVTEEEIEEMKKREKKSGKG